MTDYAVTASVADSQKAQYPSYFPSPSFSVNAANMTGGAEPVTNPNGLIYSYSMPLNGGYDGVGNLRSVTDTTTGTWSYTYDNLNRLLTGTSTAGYYTGAQMSWSYERGPRRQVFVAGVEDPFGNRTNEIVGGTVTAPMPSTSTASYTAASNQVASVNGGAGLVYDAAGDVIADPLNSYLYDGVPVDSGPPASDCCSLGCWDRSSSLGWRTPSAAARARLSAARSRRPCRQPARRVTPRLGSRCHH
jgi:YD repeat-containing protein